MLLRNSSQLGAVKRRWETVQDAASGPGLRLGVQDDDGLIGARDDGLGDGDEFFLLVEDAQPGGAPVA